MEQNDALIKLLKERAAHVSSPPRPGGFYSKEGDCVFFYNESSDAKAECVDELLTVYRALDDGRIVGVQIGGITKLLEHDLMRLIVSSQKNLDIVMLVLATFYRQRAKGIERDERKLRSYAEVIESLRGSGQRVSLKETLVI